MSAELIRRSTLTVGFGGICCLFYYWGWSTELSSFGGDSAGYMMAAQYYSPYQPTSSVVEEYSQRIIYPPLFPWLLAVTSGGTHVLAAHLMVITFLLAALIPLYLWLRNESLSPSVAGAITVLFAAMPSTRYISMSIWTENIYLFFSMVSVWAISRTHRDSDIRFWYLAAITIASASLIRVAALPLLTAFGIYLLIKRPRHWIFIGIVTSLPILTWLVLGSRGQTGITGYTDVWQQRYSTDSMAFLWNKFIEQLQLLNRTWITAWLGSNNSASLALVAQIFGILGICGFINRLTNKHFDAIYVLVYLCVLLAWHSSGEVNRYAYVIYPFAIVYGYLAALKLSNLISSSRGTRPIVSVTVTSLLLLTLTPTFLIDSKRRMMKLPTEVEAARQTDFWYSLEDRALAFYNIYNQAKLIEHFKSVNRLVPESDCIYSIKPTVITFYTDRSSVVPPPEKSTDNEFWDTMNQCNYVYGIAFTSLSYSQAFYPIQRLGRNVRVISATENHLLDNTSPIGILAILAKPNAGQ